MQNKILDSSYCEKVLKRLRTEGKKIVLCHGVFDLVHPGHIIHFNEAKKCGDILIVTVTAAKHVQKGPGRPYFDDNLRLMSIASLEMVDYVMLSHSITSLGVIDLIKPSVYVKGSEYSNSADDITANIDKETERVRMYGGDIYFTGGDTFSSTKLINNAFSALPPLATEFSKSVREANDMDSIIEYVDKFRDLKVLVVGDVIIDEYIYCSHQGLMSKDQALSMRFKSSENFLGGSLAVARHLSGFSNNVAICSATGNDPQITEKIVNEMGGEIRLEIDFDCEIQTVIKRKYVSKHGMREEYQKVFSINYLQDENKKTDKSKFYESLEKLVQEYDMVVVCDYGHGLIDKTAKDIIDSCSKYISLNCQTNSSNLGMNLITKYSRADFFSLDEREILFALSDNQTPKSELLISLVKQLNAKYGILTLGSKGAVASDAKGNLSECPALTLMAKDTVGAGDALFSVVSLCAYFDVPVDIMLLLGNAAGAIAANVLSNSQPIDRVKVLKFASTILNV